MLENSMNTRDVWIFLFFAGLFMFNWPMLAIAGWTLPAYIFASWAGFILLILVLTRTDAGSGGGG